MKTIQIQFTVEMMNKRIYRVQFHEFQQTVYVWNNDYGDTFKYEHPGTPNEQTCISYIKLFELKHNI